MLCSCIQYFVSFCRLQIPLQEELKLRKNVRVLIYVHSMQYLVNLLFVPIKKCYSYKLSVLTATSVNGYWYSHIPSAWLVAWNIYRYKSPRLLIKHAQLVSYHFTTFADKTATCVLHFYEQSLFTKLYVSLSLFHLKSVVLQIIVKNIYVALCWTCTELFLSMSWIRY